MKSAAEILCLLQKSLFSKVGLSGVTVARTIEEIENTLKVRSYELAFEESCGVSDTSQPAIFIRVINQHLNISEELAALFAMKAPQKARTFSEQYYRL